MIKASVSHHAHRARTFAERFVRLHLHFVRADARQEALLLLDFVDEAFYLLSADLEARVFSLSLVERINCIIVARRGLGRVLQDFVHAADFAFVKVDVSRVRLHLRLKIIIRNQILEEKHAPNAADLQS